MSFWSGVLGRIMRSVTVTLLTVTLLPVTLLTVTLFTITLDTTPSCSAQTAQCYAVVDGYS